ncbi:fatty-acyl-CoA synthase [Caldicoprobacter guelmensis]|uniref:sugar phosphate isomerase/epimerase family protein n=1 Tax=Caldicoprobacter guelmensis TaxID=1170224 RepID=UPI00195A8119|nr:sugar phosphate isomerase/epimerase family protein [Caldicoprobacter guelmensis]MBM7581624.1 fatty-acyl-CoA synthase [Caldicoprobacter guelmensis]
MKVCFSTLGCPDWSWEEILVAAKDLGYDGIELRGLGNEIYVPKAKPFLPEHIQASKRQLEDKGLEISCITSSCYLHEKDTETYIKEGMEYIDLASQLNARFIRVLGDSNPWPKVPVDVKQVVAMLKKLGDYASTKGVIVLLETNGVFANSNVMLKTMEELQHPYIGVLWDIHHPYRFMGESVFLTYNRLKKYIRHVHVKDSRLEKGGVRYCLIGEGDIPIKEAMDLLMQDGYTGYISLEWLKRWYYDLEEPGIVFPHFINAIKGMLS